MFVYIIYTHVYIIWCNHIPYCLICLKPVRSLDLYRNHCWLFLATWLRLACLEFRHFAKHLSNAKSTRRIWLWLPRVWGEMSHDGEIAKKNLEKKWISNCCIIFHWIHILHPQKNRVLEVLEPEKQCSSGGVASSCEPGGGTLATIDLLRRGAPTPEVLGMSSFSLTIS